MPDPLVTLGAVKLVWEESKPLRKLVWSKLPFAKDAAKRQMAEELLGKLLEDSNKLARNLRPDQAEEAIEKRTEQFKQELLDAKIPADQVETLAIRGEMFVKMLVTDPVVETAYLKVRIGELEAALRELERAQEQDRKELQTLDRRVAINSFGSQIAGLWIGFGVLLLLEAVQLFYLLSHAGGIH